MATTAELTARIALLEAAIQNFAVNGVAEYYIGGTRVRYNTLKEADDHLNSLRRQLAQQTNSGYSYAKFVGAS